MHIAKVPHLLLCVFICAALGCQSTQGSDSRPKSEAPEQAADPATQPESRVSTKEGVSTASSDLAPEDMAIATFAGGCFWCMEHPFEAIPGVREAYSGYTGGDETNPTYEEVARGRTDHAEAVRVVYDPEKVDYDLLLKVFWRNIKPTQENGQFVDRGKQYRTAIYHHDQAQKEAALESRERISRKFDEPIATEITEAGPFYPAEDYHQDFYEKSTAHYERYRRGSGRPAYVERVWGEEAGGYSLHGGERK